MKQSKIIGLTGRSGSGKGAVSAILEEFGALVIDCDEIVHNLFKYDKELIFELKDVFGDNILDKNGYIDRKKLGPIVFEDRVLLDFLTKTTHRYVVKVVVEIIKNNSEYKYIVIDAPLLLEANLHKICDSVWLVFADEEISIKRVMKRDNISFDMAKKRLNNQKSFKKLSKYADVIIKNEKSIEELRNEVKKKFK